MDERERAVRPMPERHRPDAREAIPVMGVTSAKQAIQAAQQSSANLPDPRNSQIAEKLKQRTSGGGYVISDADVVRAIRGWKAKGEGERVRALCEVLVKRCMPEFQRRSYGLRHRPDLMEEAIAGMVEQLLREAQNPREEFMLANFVHYLRCLCADNFQRVLRQEGLSYRRDAQGNPAGRGMHVPQALVDRLDVPLNEGDGSERATRELADPGDHLEARMASLEAQRILRYLSDPLDRRIMLLRVFDEMRWDDIAAICGKTERTMRLRYEKARALLRERIAAENAAAE
ncbi:MAG TPA: sigma factor-like helix-turn-helix DNA-binding protein [Ktedonobacterales bacterium]|nr:sigma factor-like helix-turn-helix DNA-binding protein [Ktedonobacterales bacterium]